MAKINIECKIQVEMLIVLGIILFFKLIISYVYQMHERALNFMNSEITKVVCM